MLTTEQYKKIMIQKAMPIINACITTNKKTPNAPTYSGVTNSTQKILFSFDPEIVKKYEKQIIDIYRDLPRTYGGISSYGYVAFEDFFSTSQDPKIKQKEMLLANAFINLSKHIGLIIPRSVTSDSGLLIGANAELCTYIPTREEEEKKKKSDDKIPGDE